MVSAEIINFLLDANKLECCTYCSHRTLPCCRFLDFGLLCRMKRKHQYAMLASIVHIVNGDWGSLVLDLTEMDVVTPGTNLRLVTMVLSTYLSTSFFTFQSFGVLVHKSIRCISLKPTALSSNGYQLYRLLTSPSFSKKLTRIWKLL